jgi:S1-C subfamily serine protease
VATAGRVEGSGGLDPLLPELADKKRPHHNSLPLLAHPLFTLLTTAFLLLFAAAARAQQERESEAEFAKRAYAATALLYSENEMGGMAMRCTVTLFARTAKGYRAVTAAHCVANDDAEHERVKVDPTNFYLTFDETGEKKFISAKVVGAGYRTRGDDFAVLEITSDLHLPTINLGDDTEETPGAPILNVASPMGLGRQIFRGYISMLRMERPIQDADAQLNWKGAMLLQSEVGGGSSGSSVLSLGQKAIVAFIIGGISGFTGSTNIVALPVSRFKTFLEAIDSKSYKYFTPASIDADSHLAKASSH